ncbi:MAG: hypothetical protein LBV23_05355, partial [Deltaproteobacteria bacterium]|nr:hypothetical protein [Deltaproteobacteria bacterium]
DLLLIRGPASVKLKKAKGLRRFSLIPLNGAALGVTLEGDFKYLVKERDLGFALTLGLSNELGSEGGLCRLRGGSLLICISTLDSAESLDELSQKRPKN